MTGDALGKVIKGFDSKAQARVVRALMEEAEGCGVPEAESNPLGAPTPSEGGFLEEGTFMLRTEG